MVLVAETRECLDFAIVISIFSFNNIVPKVGLFDGSVDLWCFIGVFDIVLYFAILLYSRINLAFVVHCCFSLNYQVTCWLKGENALQNCCLAPEFLKNFFVPASIYC